MAGNQSLAKGGGTSDSMPCVVMDPHCLKQANAQGKKVALVEEADLDALRCLVSDGGCLKRAKSLGGKVEIVDWAKRSNV